MGVLLIGFVFGVRIALLSKVKGEGARLLTSYLRPYLLLALKIIVLLIVSLDTASITSLNGFILFGLLPNPEEALPDLHDVEF